MRVHKVRKIYGMPYTVTKPDGSKKRFTNPDEAWRFMIVSGGQLCFGFRAKPAL